MTLLWPYIWWTYTYCLSNIQINDLNLITCLNKQNMMQCSIFRKCCTALFTAVLHCCLFPDATIKIKYSMLQFMLNQLSWQSVDWYLVKPIDSSKMLLFTDKSLSSKWSASLTMDNQWIISHSLFYMWVQQSSHLQFWLVPYKTEVSNPAITGETGWSESVGLVPGWNKSLHPYSFPRP